MATNFMIAGACVCLWAAGSPAFAQPIPISSGSATLPWDGSLSSFAIAGSNSQGNSQFMSEYYQAAKGGFNGGDTVDFSTTIPVTNAGNHPLPETYRGAQYQAWVTGSLTIRAKTFVAPPATGDGSTFQTFTTSFSMSGSIGAYATADRSGTPLFATGVVGGGTISATYRVVGNQYVIAHSGGELLRFVDGGNLPPPWTTADIGAVGTPGYAYQGPDGDLFFGGAGADIWGAADSFRFVYAPISGDAAISAELGGESSTQPYAKAGVMLRQSLDPGSPEVILDIKPDGGIEFMERSVAGGATTFLSGGSVSVTPMSSGVSIYQYVQLSRSGDTVTASICTPGSGAYSCQLIGTTQWMTGAALAGVAVTSHDPTTLNDSYVPADMPTLETATGTPVPAPWHYTDVGAVGTPGSASVSNDTFSVNAAGSDIWGPADSFGAVTQPLAGDGIVLAQILSETDTSAYAKVGVTIGALSASSARVILDVKPDGGVEFMARLADGVSMSYLVGGTLSFGGWIRLARTGNQVVAAISSDGQMWTTLGSVDVTFGNGIEAGLAVTSHDTTTINSARFAHPSVTASSVMGQNVLPNPGFEDSSVPAIGPGWISDASRQSPASAETIDPHSGSNNGACRTTQPLDCGLYQDVVIRASGAYTLTVFTDAGQAGAWVGWNVNGASLASVSVSVGGYLQQTFSHDFAAGDTVRVWLYLSATPGWAVIDDASLVETAAH